MNPVLRNIILAPQGIVKRELVAWYDFTDPAGSQVLTDKSGNGNHGQNGSTAGVDTNDAIFNGFCGEFSGDDYVNCGNNVLTDVVRTEASWSFWVYRRSYAQDATVISKYVAGKEQRSWNIRDYTNNSIACTISSDGINNAIAQSGSALMENNVWLNICIVFDNGKTSFYKNGELHSIAYCKQLSMYNNTTTPAIIGKYSGFYDGFIQNILVYGCALTHAEIRRNYKAIKREFIQRGIVI